MRSRVRFPALPYAFFFLKGEDAHGDHGLGSLVIRFKVPPGTSDSPLIPQSFSSGQRNRAYWASQLQKAVTLQPQPGGETTKSERTCGGIVGGPFLIRRSLDCYHYISCSVMLA